MPKSPEAQGVERHFKQLIEDERRAVREETNEVLSAMNRQRSERMQHENGKRILAEYAARTKQEKRRDKFAGFRDEGDERLEPEYV